MLARIVGPTLAPDRFPRWGYLDRYSTAPYLARALLAVVIATAVVGGVAEVAFLGRSAQETVLRKPGIDHIINVLPMPTISIPAVGLQSVTVRRTAPVVASRIRPVEDDLAVDEVDVSSAPGAAPDAVSGSEVGEGVVTDAVAIGVTPLPEILFVVEVEPRLVAIDPPAYPEIAREAGLEGTVYVRVLVWTDGTVREAAVTDGMLGLDEAALAAVRTAVFVPASQQGRPVATWMILPIEFRLH
jgi:protein TonB